MVVIVVVIVVVVVVVAVVCGDTVNCDPVGGVVILEALIILTQTMLCPNDVM
jgi:hypothetical protein